jgi:hypothetical protein
VSNDEPLKSAYDLAMERLRAKDRDAGVAEPQPLDAAQKRAIAARRDEARAKVAELEILHRKNLAEAGGDPEKMADLERKHRIDLERVEDKLEAQIAAVKAGGGA